MALVRCPEHKIPYNDDNPRGCPACAREKEGGARRASVMQELAKAQRAEAPAAKPGVEHRQSAAKLRAEGKPPPPTHPAYRRPSATTSPTPAAAVAADDSLGWLRRGLQERFRPLAIGAIVVLVIVLIMLSGPSFREGMYPVPVVGVPRPLPINPNANITTAFGALGTRTPKANPDSPRLARYTYGSDLSVDAANGVIYAITISIPNRSWRGLHAGMPERAASGALALLGTPEESSPTTVPEPRAIGRYWVYPSLDERPRRTLQVQVRPPNGCYDVQVVLQPQAIGTLEDGDRRYAVVGTDNPVLNWVITQVRIVSRSIRGPYSGIPAC